MNIRLSITLFLILIVEIFSCSKDLQLKPISVAEFSEFIAATNYKTDAEKFGWSIVQEDIMNFHTMEDVDWRLPDGMFKSQAVLPVTQVSYNDAIAYCKWANTRLPSYEEYWQFAQKDKRSIVKSMPQILPLGDVNIVGNVWEITSSERTNGEIRLAGGSHLCNDHTCNGTDPSRELYVDKTTGNVHIGFSVVVGL